MAKNKGIDMKLPSVDDLFTTQEQRKQDKRENAVMPKFSLSSDGVKWFQGKGKFKDGSYVPAAGDIIFFDWGDDWIYGYGIY